MQYLTTLESAQHIVSLQQIFGTLGNFFSLYLKRYILCDLHLNFQILGHVFLYRPEKITTVNQIPSHQISMPHQKIFPYKRAKENIHLLAIYMS